MTDPSSATSPPTGPLRAGMLLVASPELVDPSFADAVVLLLDVDDDGALGVVLNRPSPLLVSEVLEPWGDVVTEPEVLFRGGPVGTEGALAVGLLADPRDVPVGFRPLAPGDDGPAGASQLGIVDLDAPVELLEGSLEGLRIFAGYAGWSPGQLEAEVAEGSWYVVPGHPEDPFRADPVDLWRDVLRRQPGRRAWHATRPADPGMN